MEIAQSNETALSEDLVYTVFGFISKVPYSDSEAFEELVRTGKVQRINTTAWNYRKQVLGYAKKFFGEGPMSWVKLNVESNQAYGRRLDFLLSTMKFINGTSRSVSNSNWYELLEQWPDGNKALVQDSKEKILDIIKITPNISTVEFIAMWCSQPQGFEDMVCTLEIFFGPGRTTDKPAQKVSGVMSVRQTY